MKACHPAGMPLSFPLEHFRQTPVRQRALSLCFYATPDAKPVPIFAGVALGKAVLQEDLDARLLHYNAERPHLGYSNMGGRPWKTVSKPISQEA